MDDIVTQGKELGIYFYMFTGGEPLVRKKDIIRLCEKHNDVAFHAYTNSTLIDEDFCKECVRVGNLSFSLSWRALRRPTTAAAAPAISRTSCAPWI